MSDEADLEEQLRKKAARKAKPGGMPKLINIPRNWLHQALTYMDKGEMYSKVIIEIAEICLLMFLLNIYIGNIYINFLISAFVAHTWNWVTNGLFWAVIIFTFPSLRNPGAENTVKYLNDMKRRLLRFDSVAGVSLYGSITRNTWHDRSDIDLRIIRNKGFVNLLITVYLTMQERFIAFLYKQPMDMYLADDVNFLKKLRADEVPVILIKKSEEMETMYPDNPEQDMTMQHFEPAKS